MISPYKSEPNLNSYEWPKTPTGNVDWEVLFEDPEAGLIPYIEAASARQLAQPLMSAITCGTGASGGPLMA